MKYLLIVMLLVGSFHSLADRHKSRRGLPRTEVGLMNNVLGCLSNKDSVGYFNLFIPFDTLWQMVLHNADRSPEATRQLANLREHPQSLLEFDPAFNPNIMARFKDILQKGEDSGIHWKEITLQRYELEKQTIVSHTLAGYNLVSPDRYKGYVFVRDMLGRITFCISMTEIQRINGFYFGGQVLNILEAASVDQFIAKQQAEKSYYIWLDQKLKNDALHDDSVKNGLIDTVGLAAVAVVQKPIGLLDDAPDEDTMKKRKEIVDRRFYVGKFDDEIPVKMYVRYMKDLRTSKITAYDGLYKFGDQVNYVKLNIVKGADGVWTIDDDPPVGTMELELKYKVYTGSWTNNENQTGYDVTMTQTDIPSDKLQQLDKMLESGKLGRTDGETGTTAAKPAEPVVEGIENTPDKEEKEVKKKKRKEDDAGDDEKPKKKKRHRDDNE
jgi:hypothetical protein